MSSNAPSAALHVKEAGSDQNIHLENSVGDKWFLTTWANMDRFSIGRAGILDDFLINDSGFVGIGGVTNPSFPLQMASGARVTAGGDWVNASDRNLKENFSPVETRSLLERVANLPIRLWNYRVEDASIRHLGPNAQDFRAAFRLGADDKHISTVDGAHVKKCVKDIRRLSPPTPR